MKTKLSRIFGVAVTVAVLASMLVVATPASAGTLAWSSEGSQGSMPLFGGSVLDIAAAGNGTTVYAVLSADFSADATGGIIGNQELVKSTNGGATWAAVNTNTPTTTTGSNTVKLVAVAPDLADGSFLAAVVTDTSLGANPVIALSGDGGASWSFAPAIPGATTIYAIDVSRPIGTTRTIAAATDAGVFTVDLGGTFGGAWVNVSAMPGFLGGTAKAVAFSPNFAGDRTVAVVTDNTSDAIVQLFNKASSAWNAPIYPAWAAGAKIVAAGSGAVASAQLVLSPTFVGSDPGSQVAYTALVSAAGSGVYRTSGTLSTNLWAGAMYSVAVNAAGDKLVAGPADSTVQPVVRVAAPSTALATSGVPASKRPGGPATTNTVVTYAGATVLAGNSGLESAFSKSTDDGKTFIDISLVNTTLTPKDMNVASDGSKAYVASFANGTLSVFRKATAWERTGAFSITDGSTAFIIRVSPDNGDVVYVSEAPGNAIWYTNDGGYTTWTTRYSPNSVVDLAVESATALYVVTNNGYVSKSVDSGFIWDNPKTALPTPMVGDSIALIAAGNLIVGGAGGQVAYSTDNGSSFTATAAAVPAGGTTLVAADKLSSGGVIYAVSTSAVGSNVYRWTIGTSTTWTGMLTTGVVGSATGIALSSGALYVTTLNADNTSTLYRTISPTVANADFFWKMAAAQEASTAAVGGLYQLSFSIPAVGTGGPTNALDVAVGADKNPKLYAVSFSNVVPVAARKALESFTDILVTASPALSAPVERATIQINTANGAANNVVLMWNAVAGTPPIPATTYDVQVSLDSAFTQVLTFTAGTGTAVANTLLIVGPTGTAQFPFQANTTYYWRVRVNAPIYSAWSAGRSFVVAPLQPIAIQSPANGANGVPLTPTFVWNPVVGATTYELVVSDDPTFKIITFSRTSTQPVFATDEALAYGTVYYWRVRASAPATAVTDWVTGVFTTVGKPAPTTAPSTGPVITITQPAPTTITVEVPPTVSAIPAYLLWIIIGIGAILVIALIVLIVRTRRVS